MKKLFIIISLVAITGVSKAQELGIRWGDMAGNNVAVDGIFSLGEYSRIHGDLSFGDGNLGLDAIWDFAYRPLLGDEAVYWYAGAGVSTWFGDPFFLGVSGELGLQYNFNGAPISISGDWRPTFWLIEETDFRADGFGLNLRYVF